ncbi:MAG: hypothetical protein AAGE43_11450 [Pseudomonadota bacterium]
MAPNIQSTLLPLADASVFARESVAAAEADTRGRHFGLLAANHE